MNARFVVAILLGLGLLGAGVVTIVYPANTTPTSPSADSDTLSSALRQIHTLQIHDAALSQNIDSLTRQVSRLEQQLQSLRQEAPGGHSVATGSMSSSGAAAIVHHPAGSTTPQRAATILIYIPYGASITEIASQLVRYHVLASQNDFVQKALKAPHLRAGAYRMSQPEPVDQIIAQLTT